MITERRGTLLDEVEDLLGELGVGKREGFGVYGGHFRGG